MVSRKSTRPLALHLVLAACSAGVIGTVVLRLGADVTGTVVPRIVATDLAVEHHSPLTLRLRSTNGRSPGLLQISHDGMETVDVSVPEDWILREVRGAALSQVPSDPPVGGFRRWHVPAGAAATFQTPKAVRLRIHNPTGATLLVRHERVSLSAGTTEQDSVLIGKDFAEIW